MVGNAAGYCILDDFRFFVRPPSSAFLTLSRPLNRKGFFIMDANVALSDYAQQAIRISAKELIGKCGITKSDLEDIQQDMLLDLIQRLPQHDDRQWSVKTFISHVVKNRARNILRARCAEKRFSKRNVGSLNDQNGNSHVTYDRLDEQTSSAAQGIAMRSSLEEVELRHDIRVVLDKLAPRLRRCCKGFMEGRSIASLAEQENVTRQTFYTSFLLPIRQAFENAGLDGYLDVRHE